MPVLGTSAIEMAQKRPNFLLIVADDLGFSDCGCFGSEILTPNIDKLSEDGIRFTSFHVAAACSPTRAMLMSGTDHHLTGLGQLPEFIRGSPAHQNQPGHEGYLLPSVAALPELLSDGGYHTVMSGKWHLGLKPEHDPAARGFKQSFALLPGCANHYGYEPQYEDVSTEPPAFFETSVTALHSENGHYLRRLPEDFYSSDFYADKLIGYLKSRSSEDEQKPFFAYLPFAAPHWPLQAPKESMDKYRGTYADGPAALRLRRLTKLKEMGLVPNDVVAHPVVTTQRDQADWPDLSVEEREKSGRSMEAYAGMVDRMDEAIGRVIDYLNDIDEYENTCIMFMSDNGAEGASYEALPIAGEQVVAHIEKYYDNSLDNIGRSNSFVWYGPRWAQAATAPSRLYKLLSTEGGCRVPLIVKSHGPKLTCRGGSTNTFCTAMDIVPTILDFASVDQPGTFFRGRTVERIRGKSWKPFIEHLGANTPLSDGVIHDEDVVVGFECAGSGAIRKGRYKITFVPAPRGPQRWELFDIVSDPGETNDIGAEEPVIMEEMLSLWEEYKKDVGVIGVAGEFVMGGPPVDEFEDIGKWMKSLTTVWKREA